MADLTIAQVRQRFATALEAVTDWNESPFAWGVFASNIEHHRFAVGAPRTMPRPGSVGRPRQRPAVTSYQVETEIEIQWGWNLGSLDQVTDYDVAMAAEAALLAAALGVSQSSLHVTLTEQTRTVDDQGWMLGTIRLTVPHSLATS